MFFYLGLTCFIDSACYTLQFVVWFEHIPHLRGFDPFSMDFLEDILGLGAGISK